VGENWDQVARGNRGMVGKGPVQRRHGEKTMAMVATRKSSPGMGPRVVYARVDTFNYLKKAAVKLRQVGSGSWTTQLLCTPLLRLRELPTASRCPCTPLPHCTPPLLVPHIATYRLLQPPLSMQLTLEAMQPSGPELLVAGRTEHWPAEE
jgi:hypothetical protein